MPLICPHCGHYELGNAQRSEAKLRCEYCAQDVSANILPLFVVTGASGAGKSSVLPLLRAKLPNFIVMDADLLWGRSAEGQFLNNWLKIAYANAQSGAYTLLCGTVMPWDLDACEDRNLVGRAYYLNLHCDDADRERRLRARPAFRNTTEAFVEEHRRFADWLLENAGHRFGSPMPTVNTSRRSTEETAEEIARWIESHLAGRQPEPKPSLAPGS